jgi:type I site-specific restriction endonuclease
VVEGSRILFLTDSKILVDQAYNAFSAVPEGAMVHGGNQKEGKGP